MAMRGTLDVESLWKLARVASPSVSPDGAAAVCAVTSYSMQDNRGATALWLLPTQGGAPRRLTRCGEKDGKPAWSPTGERIAFLGRREQEGGKDGTAQLYVIDRAGGEAERATRFGPGFEDFRWMPDGKRVLLVAWTWPDEKGAKAQDRRHKAFKERKESAYVTAEPNYRHFDRNLPQGRVPHLWLLDLASGRLTDLFEGTGLELPRVEPGAIHFDVSPDGRRIAFAHDPSPRKLAVNPLAISEMEIASRRLRPVAKDPAWAYEAPRYSPDGRTLACIATHVEKRHTSFGRLAFVAAGQRPKVVGARWDIDVEGPLRWTRDGAALLFAAEEKGRRHLWRYDIARDSLAPAVKGGWVQGFDAGGPAGDETIVVVADGASHPARVHAVRAGAARRIDRFNDEAMAAVTLGETREAWIKGARGDAVQVFLTFPPRFDPKRRHPVLQVIHGGPYAAAGDTFGYRWNPHAFAAAGYVVAAVNFHGSSGFGHAFRDSIMGRQGRLETEDIERATDWILAHPWADRGRVFAAGGSYGGFLVAWMNGHVKAGRYLAYVCHAGVFDRVLTFSADSFLHRPRDLHALYWEKPAKVRAQSPSSYAHRMATPTLVIHGTEDYRVPDANGLAYYNTLVARGVPARLVWFPDENHWVLKPRNSRLWYGEFLGWLAAHDPGAKRGRRG